MELVLEVVSSERHLMGDNATYRFLPAGGVIGRSADCDWVIPDQTRHLSGRHAIVSYEAGQFFITDISTNGVYLNGPDPLAKNVAMALHDEDRLVMGEIQFRAHLHMEVRPRAAMASARPFSPSSVVQGDSPMQGHANPMAAVDAFVAERQREVQAQPQEWHRQSGSMPDNVRPEQEAFAPPKPLQAQPVVPVLGNDLPENWLDMSELPGLPAQAVAEVARPVQNSFAAPMAPIVPVVPVAPAVPAVPAPPVAPPSIPRPGARPAPPSLPSTLIAPVPQRPAAAPAAPLSSAALAAFAKGLGLTPEAIESAGSEEFMQRAGQLLRLCLQGLVSNAHARASLKNEFRLDMTLVNARSNNPIKFSANADQVLKHLLADDNGSFLSVEEAVQECVDDFQQHQVAMMAGMQSAFMELIQQLSPAELERRFERVAARGFASKGARFWDAYRELHQDLQEEDDIFGSLFVEPFAKAYDQQIEKLKTNSKKKE